MKRTINTKNIFVLIGLYGGMFTSTIACGMSPQFNHRDADVVRKNANHNIRTTEGAEGCDFYFKTQNLCATLAWEKTPTRLEEGSFKLAFWNRDQGTAQQPVFMDPDSASVFVKLWMSSMNHGSQKVVMTKAKSDEGFELDGVYSGTEVFFVMPGAWEIIVQLKDDQGVVTDSSTLNYQAQ